jgi:hypothetical protein
VQHVTITENLSIDEVQAAIEAAVGTAESPREAEPQNQTEDKSS